MTPEREYQVARAVWLYQRLSIAMEREALIKFAALSRRIQRWLVYADEGLRKEYYRRITLLDAQARTEEQREQIAEVSRARGRRVMALIPPEEITEQFRRESDDAEGVE